MLEEFSACIIAKDEENNLPRLLNSIKGKFREIILVDTGSKDKTVEIAQSYGCKVFHTEWIGFADARNFAVEKASGEWIWHFDADTELEEEEYERFKSFYIINKGRLNKYEGISVTYKNIESESSTDKFSFSSTIHIHKKADNIKWVGKIHERVINIDKGYISIPAKFSVQVLHYGYASSNVQIKKIRRNLCLIIQELKKIKRSEKELQEYGVNLFYMIQTHLSAYHNTKNRKFLRKADFYIKKLDGIIDHLNKDHLKTFIVHFCVYASNLYINMLDYDKALYFVEKGMKIEPNYPDLLYSKAAIKDLKGLTEEAFMFFVYFLDKVENFEEGITSDYAIKSIYIASERIPQLFSSLDDDKKAQYIRIVENLFKEKLSMYIGISLFKIYLISGDTKKAESLIKKLNRLYNDKDLLMITIDFLLKQNKKDQAEKLLINKIDKIKINLD